MSDSNDLPQGELPGASAPGGVPTPGGVPASGGAPAPQQEPNKKKQNIIILILALLLLCGGIYFIYSSMAAKKESEFHFDDNALDGQLEGKTLEEIQEELNRRVDENMLSISINTAPVFKDGKAEGNLRIENSPANHYFMIVEIYLNDETKEGGLGERIYRSGGIKTGQHIENAKLDKNLAKGTYNATAFFIAHNPDTLQEVGRAGAQLSIVVQN